MTAWNTAKGDDYELFFGFRDEQAFIDAVEDLVADRVASRLAARDHTLWGPAAEDESGKRLAWVSLATSSRPLVDEILGLAADLREARVTVLALLPNP